MVLLSIQNTYFNLWLRQLSHLYTQKRLPFIESMVSKHLGAIFTVVGLGYLLFVSLSWLQMKEIRGGDWKVIFLFLSKGICYGCSKEPSQWDGSFEHPQYILRLIDKKIFGILCSNICLRVFFVVFVFLFSWKTKKCIMCTQNLPSQGDGSFLIPLTHVFVEKETIKNLFFFSLKFVLNLEIWRKDRGATIWENVPLSIRWQWVPRSAYTSLQDWSES